MKLPKSGKLTNMPIQVLQIKKCIDRRNPMHNTYYY